MSIIEIAATVAYCAIGIVFAFPFAHHMSMKLKQQHKAADLLVALLVGAALAAVWPLALLGMSVSDNNG